MKVEFLKQPKVLILLKVLNTFFKLFVALVFMWILVVSLSTTSLPQIEQTLQEGGSYRLLQENLPVWKALRNIGYGMTVILLVIQALSGTFFSGNKPEIKEEIKVQNLKTLKYLVALTFSYALAGLAVDLIYVAYFISKAS